MTNAAQAGLGSWHMADIRIDGRLEKIKDFKVPPLGGEAIQDNVVIQEMLESKTLLTPQPDPETCTACGACVEQCPAEALSIPEDLPVADMARCVTCFCCQEICPEKAMVLQ